MLGAIIGDIVGSRWEFNPTNDYNFEWLSGENGFTDDTICTVAVADALLKGKDFGESIYEWCNRYPHPMGGYGGRFAQWVRSDNPQPYNSFGNGSAMRVSPVAWAAHDLEFKYYPNFTQEYVKELSRLPLLRYTYCSPPTVRPFLRPFGSKRPEVERAAQSPASHSCRRLWL